MSIPHYSSILLKKVLLPPKNPFCFSQQIGYIPFVEIRRFGMVRSPSARASGQPGDAVLLS